MAKTSVLPMPGVPVSIPGLRIKIPQTAARRFCLPQLRLSTAQEIHKFFFKRTSDRNQHPDFGLTASRTVKQHISFVLIHPAFGTLLGQP